MWHYRFFGLHVSADIELAGAPALGGLAQEPEVEIRLAPVPRCLRDVTARGPNWEIAGKRVLLCVPELVRFLITDGREIELELEPGVEPRDIIGFLLGSVLAIVLNQRGLLVLRAAALALNGGAVAFCGASGAGKSTLAAIFSKAGYTLVTEDICALSLVANDRPMVLPDGQLLKLWDDAIRWLNLNERRRHALRDSIQKFYVDAPSACAPQPLPLAALYELTDPVAPKGWDIVPTVSTAEASQLLLRNIYHPLLVRPLAQLNNYSKGCVIVPRHVRTFTLARPLDLGLLAEGVARIESHWQDLGLL